MEKDDIYAITEVYYILKKFSLNYYAKIPNVLYKIFEENYDETIYSNLNINNQTIERISEKAKLLLKIIILFLK